MPHLCPIDHKMGFCNGGICSEDKCAWWIRGNERTDPEQGPYGPACAIKSLAVEAQDLEFVMKDMLKEHIEIKDVLKEIKDEFSRFVDYYGSWSGKYYEK